MKIVSANVEFVTPIDAAEGLRILEKIETCGRTCYKSEDKIGEDTAKKFVANIIKRGHESVLEHVSFTLRFICDRGVSHEIVRHRLASYSQESTRYCNYTAGKFGREITVIEPLFFERNSYKYEVWKRACSAAEGAYQLMISDGATPQEARSILPNSLKTEVVMTANLREWRHFFRLRCSQAAHPQMREVAFMALNMCRDVIPVVFDDVYEEVVKRTGPMNIASVSMSSGKTE